MVVSKMSISDNKEIEISKIFKALGDENRLCILRLLNKEELCGCQLLDELEIGQSTLSHHMKILEEAGLINSNKVGKWCKYSLNKSGWQRAKSEIMKITKCLGDE